MQMERITCNNIHHTRTWINYESNTLLVLFFEQANATAAEKEIALYIDSNVTVNCYHSYFTAVIVLIAVYSNDE